MPYTCTTGDDNPVIITMQQLDGEYESASFCADCWGVFVANAFQATFRPDVPLDVVLGMVGRADVLGGDPGADDDQDQADDDDQDDDTQPELPGPDVSPAPVEEAQPEPVTS